MVSLKDCLTSSIKYIKKYSKELNEMNVFPVADNDTGKNILRTFEFIEKTNISSLDIKKNLIYNACGNSGNILSMFFRQWPEYISDTESLKVSIEKGLEDIQACISPVEGTIWTAMNSYPRNETDLNLFFEKWMWFIEDSIEISQDTLKILKDYNSLDSGAVAFYYILYGIMESLGIKYNLKHFYVRRKNRDIISDNEYCIEVLLRTDDSLVIDGLSPLGNSMISYRDSDLIKIHIHSESPDRVLQICESYGRIVRYKIEKIISD